METHLLIKKNKFRINYKILFYNIIFAFFVFFSYNVLKNLEYEFSDIFISLLFNFLIFSLSIFNLKKLNIKENKIKFITMIINWIFLFLFLNVIIELIIVKNILHLKSMSLDFINLIYLISSLIFLVFLNFINIYRNWNFYYFSFNILFFSYLAIFLHYKFFYIFTFKNNDIYNIHLDFNILLISEFIVLFIIFIIRIIYNKAIVKYKKV